jgi:transposase
MGWGIKLTEEQWDELDHLRFSTRSADVFRNCLIILMSDSSDTIADITEHLGCCPDTVIRIRRLYRKGGVDALKPVKPPGRPGRATPEFIGQMRRAVMTNPLTLGYGFSTWSLARLAAHLAKVTGVRRGTDQLGRLLRRHGFSFQRPKHTLKGKRDEAAYEKSRVELNRLKKKPSARTPPKPWFSRTRSRYIATRR